MRIVISDIRRFFSRGQADWIDALAEQAPHLAKANGVTTAERWRQFMAQIAAETDGLALPHMTENMHYRAARILEVYAYRVNRASKSGPFRGQSAATIAAKLAADPDLLAETVYGNRRELGNVKPGDGAAFIGRGPLQTTGREWYARIGKEIGVDLVASPQLLGQPSHGWAGAFAEWRLLGCNEIADTGNCVAVSKRVNGGTNGLDRRRAEYRRTLSIWHGDGPISFGSDDAADPVGKATEEPLPRSSVEAPATDATLPRMAKESTTFRLQLGAILMGIVASIKDVAGHIADGLHTIIESLPDITSEVSGGVSSTKTLAGLIGVPEAVMAGAGALGLFFLVRATWRHLHDRKELKILKGE